MTMDYLQRIKAGALATWHSHQILPSVTGAQAALESGWGTSALARPPYNNNFGIKVSDDWTGRRVTMPTQEQGTSGLYWTNGEFRVYDTLSDSIKDHGAFFTSTDWRKNNYKAVVGERDYRKACWALQNAGYATDKGYATKLIALIEKYQLMNWDQEAFSGKGANAETSSIIPTVNYGSKIVGGQITEATRSGVRNLSVLVIGDSLGVGTEKYLKQLIPNSHYNVKGNRQWTHSQADLNATNILKNSTLRDYVVMILGTNRGVNKSEIDEVAKYVGQQSKRLLLVDTASEVRHASQVSSEYEQASVRYDHVYYVKWSSEAKPMISAYYYADGANGARIHMNATGYQKHAEYIANALYEVSSGTMVNSSRKANNVDGYANIRDLTLLEDGTLTYYAYANEIRNGKLTYVGVRELTVQTDIKGLYSPKGESKLYNPAANRAWGFVNSGTQAQWIEGRYENSNSPGGRVLLEEAAEYLKAAAQPSAQYKIQLADIPDELTIGQTGIFVDHEFNPPLYIEARVLEITESETDPSRNSVVIGNVTELFPQDKSMLEGVRREIEQSRTELEEQWKKGQTTFSMENIGGLLIENADKPIQLIVKAFQGDIDISEWYTEFEWRRVSSNSSSDEIYNQKIVDYNSGVLTVSSSDLEGEMATFICTIREKGEVQATLSAIVRVAQYGKSAYELALANGFNGTLNQWLLSLKGKDGINGIPGEKGQDGKTQYWHIAYANSVDGRVDFSLTDSNKRRYIGSYLDFNQADSSDPSKYTWVDMVGSVEFGGKNYLEDSLFNRGLWQYSQGNSSLPDWSVTNGEYILTATTETWRQYQLFSADNPNNKIASKLLSLLEDGGEYTFSVEAICFSGSSEVWFDLRANQKSNAVIPNIRGAHKPFTVTSEWKRYYFTGKINRGNNFNFWRLILGYSHIGKVGFRKPMLVKGNVKSDYIQAEEDLHALIENETKNRNNEVKKILKDMEGKVDAESLERLQREHAETSATAQVTQEYIQRIQGELQKLQQAQAAKAAANEVSRLQSEIATLRNSLASDKKSSESNLLSALSRLATIENSLGDMAERWKFLDIQMSMSEEGFVIGNQSKGTYLLQKDDRISFFNNGSEIAFISGGMLQITQAVFVERIQISEYLIGAYENDPEILVIKRVGKVV